MGIAGRSYDFLLVEQLDRVLRLTINRPDRRNAISRALQAELIDAVEAGAADASVHAVIIRGAGTCFCSGYDVSSAQDAPQVSLPRRAIETVAMARAWSRLWNAPLPVIAQIHGQCLAGCTDSALHCDLMRV